MSASLLTDLPAWRRPVEPASHRQFTCGACGWREEGHVVERPTFCPACGSAYVTMGFVYAAAPKCDCCPTCGRRCDC